MEYWNVGKMEYWKKTPFPSFHYSIIPLFTLVFIFIATTSYSQVPSDKNLFRFPLDTSLVLVGSFAEIRTNHFHSGIDISTGEAEGKRVLAAADGYVSRIKVAPDGFGKALYITHRNGYVTVYGHLQRYNDTLEKVVLAEQYKRESFPVEIFPPENQFPVKQGELVAFSGNTGGSEGPHLHFEIRDEKTEEPLNVLDFGFTFRDSLPPVIHSIAIYPENGSVNDSCTKKIIPFRKSGKNYLPADSSMVTVNGNIFFGIETSDRQLANGSDLGIKSLELWLDDKKIYDYSIGRFRFDESKFVNASIDYAERISNGRKIIVLNRQPADYFNGLIKDDPASLHFFGSNGLHKAVFKVNDFHNNSAEAILNFKSSDKTIACPKPSENDTTFFISCKKTFIKQTQDFSVSTGKLPLVYKDTYIIISKREKNKKLFSKIYKVGDKTIPVHNAYNLDIKPDKLPKRLWAKALIVKVEDSGYLSAAGGSYKDGFVSASVSSFGNYAVAVDTVAPVIQAHNMSTRGERGKIFFKIKITDDLSGIGTYRATINKKWFLMEYDAKSGTLTGQMPVTSKGKYQFVLTVTDKKGNTARHSAVMQY